MVVVKKAMCDRSRNCELSNGIHLVGHTKLLIQERTDFSAPSGTHNDIKLDAQSLLPTIRLL